MAATESEIDTALKSNDFRVAKMLVKNISQTSPDYGLKDYYRALIALNEGKYDKAEDYIEKALDKKPDAKVYNLAGSVYGVQAREANIFSKLGYAKKSKKNFLKAYNADPNHKDYIISLLQFNIQAPSIAGGDSDQIEPLLEQLEKIDIKSATQLRLQYIADEEGEEQALTFINNKVADNPKALYLLYYRAFLYENAKKHELAYKDFHQIIINQPDDMKSEDFRNWNNSLYRLGRLASIEGKWLQEGQQSFVTYLQLDHDLSIDSKAWANYRLGLIYQQMNNNVAAKKVFTIAKSMKTDKELTKRLKKI